MPANLTPEYFKAERWLRQATTNDEKILAVERMLAVIPKHKGTDHMRAELRRKLSNLKEVGEQRAAKGKQTDVFYIPKTGAVQIAMIGTPNSGKSSIVGALTNAKVIVADFPFATSTPAPGMIQFEDIQIQIIDTPPITAQYSAPGQVGVYRNCDLIAIVVDLSAEIGEQVRCCLDYLESRNLLIDESAVGGPVYDSNGRPLGKRAFYLGTKADIPKPNAAETIRGISSRKFNIYEVSVHTGQGTESLPVLLFKEAGIIRVYTKPPGKKADMRAPFTLPVGSTVLDLANAIHKDLADKFKAARIWGAGVYDGQNAPRDHILSDKDIVELHFG
jgi:ribosome-interacting GTPase 1